VRIPIVDFDLVLPVLNAVGLGAAAEEPLDPIAIAADIGRDLEVVLEVLGQLEDRGLILRGGDEYGHVPILLHAGSQYLAARGNVPRADVAFLSDVIDDLHARAALRIGATVLVDQFRGAATGGELVGHARQLVPPAFVGAVDLSIAVDLFAAAVALTVRLGLGYPAGCLAEEILSVEILDIASGHLEAQHVSGELTADEAGRARQELRGIFELFEDDDVLDLFDMAEPADAAVAGHSWTSQQMGKVDQRLESWFRPFGFVSPSGYYLPHSDDDDADEDGRPGPIPGPK
jgi:hypothetical protein